MSRLLALALASILISVARPALVEGRAQAQAGTQACDPYGPANVSLSDNRKRIRYCGRITDGGLEAVSALLRGDVRSLAISSAGGSYKAPLDLAILVERNALELHVTGICFSGCASVVFVAADRRVIGPNGVLGFHNTSSSAFHIVHANFMQRRQLFEPLFRRYTAEQSLYMRKGVDPRLLIHGQVAISPLCVEMIEQDGQYAEPAINIYSEYDLWIPNLREARMAGLTWEGSLPSNIVEAYTRMARQIGGEAYSVRLIYTAQSAALFDTDMLQAIGECILGN